MLLVVEDERKVRQRYQLELEKEGYHVVTAADGRSALRKLVDEPVDLVVLDLSLPDGSGLDYLQRFMEIKRHVKVVINATHPHDKTDFNSWAADAFLTKSSDLAELKNTIGGMLR
jgi:DNA-binding response OmpR family regulator